MTVPVDRAVPNGEPEPVPVVGDPWLTQVQSLHSEVARLTADRDEARAEVERLREALTEVHLAVYQTPGFLRTLIDAALAPPPGEPTDG